MSPQIPKSALLESERLGSKKRKIRQSKIFEAPAVLEEVSEKEDMLISSVLSDSHMRVMTAIMRGYSLSKSLAEDDVRAAAKMYSAHPASFVSSLRMRIASLQVAGSTWDSQRSVRLRRSFREKEPHYLRKLEVITPLHIRDYRIHGKSLLGHAVVSDVFSNFWGCGVRKSRARKRGAKVSLLIREFQQDGSILFIAAKSHGKEKDKNIADFIVDSLSSKMMEPSSFDSVLEKVDELSEKIFPHKASLVLGLRTNGVSKLYLYGDFNLYSTDGEIFHVGTEDTRLGENFQVLNGRRVKRVIKISSLKPSKLEVDFPFFISSHPIEEKPPFKKAAIKKLSSDDNVALAMFG